MHKKQKQMLFHHFDQATDVLKYSGQQGIEFDDDLDCLLFGFLGFFLAQTVDISSQALFMAEPMLPHIKCLLK